MSLRSSSLILLDSFVRTNNLPGDGTATIPLSSGGVQAFGFDDDDEVVDPVALGLVLEAHLVAAPDLSFLALRGGSMFTSINAVDKNLIIIASTFPEDSHREVFLIFDAVDRSFRMFPAMSRDLHMNRTYRVLAVRHHDEDDDGRSSYSLVIPGTATISVSDEGFAERHDVLFISSPCAPSTLRWPARKMANFPKPPQLIDDHFFADKVFSFRGRGYWADLLNGVMHCNCGDVLSDGGVDPVDFRFFGLPGPRLTDPRGRESVAELSAFRAMGCVAGSIKFVSIDGYVNRFDRGNIKDRSVTVWRLTEDLEEWAVEDELSMQSLWEMQLAEFYLKKYSSPPNTSLAPMYPFLSVQEDRVIYFALGEFVQGTSGGSFPTNVHSLLRVDMRRRRVSTAPVPYSEIPTLDRFMCFDYSILCPAVAVEDKMNNMRVDED